MTIKSFIQSRARLMVAGFARESNVDEALLPTLAFPCIIPSCWLAPSWTLKCAAAVLAVRVCLLAGRG